MIKLNKDQQNLIGQGLKKLFDDKNNKYKRMGTPQSIEALDDYKEKLNELNEIGQLIEDCTNSPIVIYTSEEELNSDLEDK